MKNIFNFIKRLIKPPSHAAQDSRIMWALYHPQQGFEVNVLADHLYEVKEELSHLDIMNGWTVQKVRVSLAEE